MLRALGDIAYGAGGDAASRPAKLAGQACPELLLGIGREG
jgi:hypothetical protein